MSQNTLEEQIQATQRTVKHSYPSTKSTEQRTSPRTVHFYKRGKQQDLASSLILDATAVLTSTKRDIRHQASLCLRILWKSRHKLHKGLSSISTLPLKAQSRGLPQGLFTSATMKFMWIMMKAKMRRIVIGLPDEVPSLGAIARSTAHDARHPAFGH